VRAVAYHMQVKAYGGLSPAGRGLRQHALAAEYLNIKGRLLSARSANSGHRTGIKWRTLAELHSRYPGGDVTRLIAK